MKRGPEWKHSGGFGPQLGLPIHESTIEEERHEESGYFEPGSGEEEQNQEPHQQHYKETAEMTLNLHINMEFFKGFECKKKGNHNHTFCPYFHSIADRKRIGIDYSRDLCPYAGQNLQCPRYEKCKFSHNRIEQLFKDEYYKTKFCSHYPDTIERCEYGYLCSFAHSEKEIKIELIHNYVFDIDFYLFKYKTIHCPFNLLYHDKGLCVYSHNWQDFRRNPEQFNYKAEQCQHWNTNKMIFNYEDGCPQGLNCMYSHGWKELAYHPLSYRTAKCTDGEKCTKKYVCSMYHNKSEKRNKKELFNGYGDQVWLFTPKNRNVEGISKPIKSIKNNQSKPCSIESAYRGSNGDISEGDSSDCYGDIREKRKKLLQSRDLTPTRATDKYRYNLPTGSPGHTVVATKRGSIQLVSSSQVLNMLNTTPQGSAVLPRDDHHTETTEGRGPTRPDKPRGMSDGNLLSALGSERFAYKNDTSSYSPGNTHDLGRHQHPEDSGMSEHNFANNQDVKPYDSNRDTQHENGTLDADKEASEAHQSHPDYVNAFSIKIPSSREEVMRLNRQRRKGINN